MKIATIFELLLDNVCTCHPSINLVTFTPVPTTTENYKVTKMPPNLKKKLNPSIKMTNNSTLIH